MAKYTFIVYARDGDYDEKRWMLVSGWPTRKSAEQEAKRLNSVASDYRDAKREFRPEPDLIGDEASFDREWDAWKKERDAMVDRFRRKMRLRALDHYDDPSFHVEAIPCHERATTSTRNAPK